MAKNKTVRVTEEELELLKQLRESRGEAVATAVESAAEPAADSITQAQQSLADAFVSAIERTKPVAKKTVFDRKVNTPWTPPVGTPRAKMKRKFYHHGIQVSERVTNEEIELLNQLRPGHYCEGFVKITLRKDRGIDIDYPVKTASQRLRLVNQFGIRSFSELLQRLIDEHKNPSKFRRADDLELFD